MVIDATGGPVEGAGIVAAHLSNAEDEFHAVSDAAGRFTIATPPGETMIVARADAYSRAQQRVVAPANITLVLAPASQIIGRVIDRKSNQPIAGLSITATNRSGVGAPTTSALADAKGEFVIRELVAGGYEVSAIDATHRSSTAWVTVGVGQSSDHLELVVDSATTLDVEITAAGEPCEFAWIDLDGPVVESVRAKASGEVHLDGLLPGTYAIDVHCRQALPEHAEFAVEAVPMKLAFELSEGLRLRGKVQRESGAPIAGATVYVDPKEGSGADDPLAPKRAPGSQCMSDASGSFSCGGLVAANYQYMAAVGGQSISERETVTVADQASTEVVITANPIGTIRALVDEGSRSSAELVVIARKEGEAPIQALRDTDGFVFDGLALGAYEVFLAPAVDRGAGAQRVELTRDGEVHVVNLHVPAADTITGKVVDAALQPVPEVWVRAIPSPSDVPSAAGNAVLSDADGAFAIEGVLPGRYELHVAGAGGEATLPSIEAGARGVVVRMKSYGAMSGTVRRADGEVINAYTIQYSLAEGAGGQVPAGAGGRWSLPWLAPGLYHLAAVTTLGLTNVDIELEPGASLEVPLVISDAQPRNADLLED
jgi:hypothetical protein